MNKLQYISALLVSVIIAVGSPALANQTEKAYTSVTRYNLNGQVTGTISPRLSNGAAFPAVRNTYNQRGLLTSVETGVLANFQNETIQPSAWSGFSVYQKQSFTYDDLGRKTSAKKEIVNAAQSNTQSSPISVRAAVTEYSYDAYNRVICIAKRLNGTILGDACTLGSNAGFGEDRITAYEYTNDNFGLIEKERRAVGTADEQIYITNRYDNYGKLTDQIDANNNLTHLEYNLRHELTTLYFPDKVLKNTYSAVDKESYTYDDNGNRKTLTKRDGTTIVYDYDALNREIKKTIPVPANGSQNVYTTYDLLNLKTSARFGSTNGAGIIYTYSGFGEVIRESSTVSGTTYTVNNRYDKHSNRTAVIHNDNTTFTYVYDSLDRNTHIHEGNSNGPVLITNGADNFARQQSQTTAGSAVTSITYDSLSRPDSIGWALNSTAYNAKHTFGFNPVGQIVQQDFSNDLFQYKEAGSKVGSYQVNNLNQYTNIGLQVYGYDKNGNLICDGMYNATSNACTLGTRYTYDVENRLTSLSGDKNATLKYDPAGRLYQFTANGKTTNFHYNGDQMIGEFSGPTLLKRYVFAVGVDKPILAYTNNQITTGTRQFLHSNHQGSIVMASNSSGNMQYVNTYDAFGVPGKVNQGRFGYTGQMYLPEIGLYYYKARIYYPQIGRFLQTDPIGYEDDYNLYAYTGNDPVNMIDPSGMSGCTTSEAKDCREFTQQIPEGDAPGKPDIVLTGETAQQFVSDIQSSDSVSPKTQPPKAPPGVDVNKNIRFAYLLRARDPRLFKKLVQNKGPWDYKQQGREYGKFGNFNYGATGLAAGFSEDILLRMAGYAQQQAGTSLPEWGDPWGDAPYGDDPADQQMIKSGFDYYYETRY